jgi:hypothetical protein
MADMTDSRREIFAALGEAVIRLWSHLPQDIQQRVFEEAVASHGEALRAGLAVFLHEKHTRTHEHKRAVPEPDSLGG